MDTLTPEEDHLLLAALIHRLLVNTVAWEATELGPTSRKVMLLQLPISMLANEHSMDILDQQLEEQVPLSVLHTVMQCPTTQLCTSIILLEPHVQLKKCPSSIVLQPTMHNSAKQNNKLTQ